MGLRSVVCKDRRESVVRERECVVREAERFAEREEGRDERFLTWYVLRGYKLET